MEVWKKVNSYENHLVSSMGRVKRLREITSTGKVIKEKLLSCIPHSLGYKRASLTKNGKRKTKYIHRLVAEQFIPNPNGLPEVNHKDLNKANNKVENLEWVSRQENVNHHHHYHKVFSYQKAGQMELFKK